MDGDDAREWDEVYTAERGDTPIWSGRPNGSLVAGVEGLAPGTALDVGCGEGADAVWLAERGWRVTALDPSSVAVARARVAAARAGVEVAWLVAGLLDLPDDAGPFDLVSAQYPALRRADDRPARALLDAVAPGGLLLVVHHDPDGAHDEHGGHEHGGHEHGGHEDVGHVHGEDGGHEHEDHGFDPDDYVLPHDVAALLDDDWAVEVHEARDRPGPLPPEARHVRDVVLLARRRA